MDSPSHREASSRVKYRLSGRGAVVAFAVIAIPRCRFVVSGIHAPIHFVLTPIQTPKSVP